MSGGNFLWCAMGAVGTLVIFLAALVGYLLWLRQQAATISADKIRQSTTIAGEGMRQSMELLETIDGLQGSVRKMQGEVVLLQRQQAESAQAEKACKEQLVALKEELAKLKSRSEP